MIITDTGAFWDKIAERYARKPAPDESVDVVLGLSILYLVADKEAIIAKVRKMLKPAGCSSAAPPASAISYGFSSISSRSADVWA